MAKRIYWILLIISIIIGAIVFSYKEIIPIYLLLVVLFCLFTMIVSSIHGIIAHSLDPRLKGGLIAYPLLMGALFAVLFFICFFFIIPLFFPGFLSTFN